MKFQANTRRRAVEYEKDLVKQWKKNKTFEKSIEQRSEDEAYVFYDGPPFITGVPHHGTLLSSIVKDAVPRYQTMKGKRVERVWGWDCHGVPAENFIEKKLGITTRHEVGEKITLEDYINTARESMIQTGDLWESTIDRIGRWVDFKGAYKTMDKEYMESVWWAFKRLYDKGKIYEGEKVLMYDTKWATPLSKAEMTMDAGTYIEVTDPSVYVKFKLIGSDEYLLAWTTTPWTLPANTGLAVNSEIVYAKVVLNGEKFILAKDLLENVLTDEKNKVLDYKVYGELNGSDLVGQSYEPIFGDRGENAHKIWSADYVSTESGTGIVHIAPAYGEEDFALAQEKNIPVVHVLDDFGIFTETDWKGEDVWEINKTIAKALKENGTVWKIDYIRHEYPHNPRTGNRLMYRAHPSWFMDIDSQRTEMLEQNSANIEWFPEHIKHGRFEKTVLSAPDWNLSRDRFWATAMPVWKGVDADGDERIKVVGSYAELKELSGVELDDYHRPWVDDITFEIDGVEYKRVDKVLDGWFESGSMPFAQFHYPFENVEKFEKNFPGDFIVEYVGQVRAWFYYVHAVSVALFGRNAFKNVIVTGNVAGNDGFKMSKSRGNFTDPNELMDAYSADSLRFLLLSSPLLNAEDFALQDRDVGDVARKLGMAWNMYDFFTMYAEVDGWEFDGNLEDPYDDLENPLDQWVVSRVHQLIAEIEENMDEYDIPNAMKPILPFLDDASNWFVRRSRRRFWKSEDDGDKSNAYRTLHYILVKFAQAVAPFTPFLAEELYQKLTGGESVHLLDWPDVGSINEILVNEMAAVRELINSGLSQRAKERIKVRQPLRLFEIHGRGVDVDALKKYVEVFREELNVKDVLFNTDTYLPTDPEGQYLGNIDTAITEELRIEGLAREVIRHIQAARKEAGLNVDDRIKLAVKSSNSSILAALENHSKLIATETLATKLDTTDEVSYKNKTIAKVDGVEFEVLLEKA